MTVAGYWDHFYEADHPDIENASTFARYCAPFLDEGQTLFEIGCGNGRDALYFARSGMRVTASDASKVAVDHLRDRATTLRAKYPPGFVNRPMEQLDDRHAGQLDAVYLRFVLHAVSPEVASRGLTWAARNLRTGGLLFVEARSVLGSLYGKGEPAGRDAFIYDGHYRRFIRKAEFAAEIESLNLAPGQLIESDGLAVHGDDDPVVIRVVATKVAEAPGAQYGKRGT